LADDTLKLVGPEREHTVHKTLCRTWLRPLATLAGVFLLGWLCGDGVQDLGIGKATATVEYHGSRLLKDVVKVGEPLPVAFQLVPHANCQGTSRRYWLYDNGEVAQTETYQWRAVPGQVSRDANGNHRVDLPVPKQFGPGQYEFQSTSHIYCGEE